MINYFFWPYTPPKSPTTPAVDKTFEATQNVYAPSKTAPPEESIVQEDGVALDLPEGSGRHKVSDTINFPAYPSTFAEYSPWKTQAYRLVSVSYTDPDSAFEWIRQVDVVTKIEELQDSHVPGHRFGELDLKIYSGLMRTIHGPLLRKIKVLEDKFMNRESKLIKGRQVLFLIRESFKLEKEELALVEFNQLQSLYLRGDNLEVFIEKWDTHLEKLVILMMQKNFI